MNPYLKGTALALSGLILFSASSVAQAQVDSTGVSALRGTPRLESPVANTGTQYQAWTVKFAGQQILVPRYGFLGNHDWVRITSSGSVESRNRYTGSWERNFTPTLGTGGNPLISASCVTQGGQGSNWARSRYFAVVPIGNPATGSITDWKVVTGSNTGISSCYYTWNVVDYRSNGTVSGQYRISYSD